MVWLGLVGVCIIGMELVERIVIERECVLYILMVDLVCWVGVSIDQMEVLATVGAFDGFGVFCCDMLWVVGVVVIVRPG